MLGAIGRTLQLEGVRRLKKKLPDTSGLSKGQESLGVP